MSDQTRTWVHEYTKEEEVYGHGSWLQCVLFIWVLRMVSHPEEWIWVLILTLAAVSVVIVLTYDIAEAVRAKTLPWKRRKTKTTTRHTVSIADGYLECKTTCNGKRFPYPRNRIALADIWGVKNTGYEIRILRKKNFEAVFSILTTDFADLDAKADFLQTMESLGKRVFSRAEDPAAVAQLEREAAAQP